MRSRPLLTGAWVPASVSGAISITCGMLVFGSPGVALATLLAGVFVGALFSLPLFAFAPTMVVGAALIPSILVEGKVGGLPVEGTPLGGQVRLLLCLVFVALIRSRTVRIRPVGPIRIAVLAYLALVLFEVVVSLIEGRIYGGIWADLYRQLGYMSAFIIGSLAARDAIARGDGLKLFRWLAVSAGTVMSTALVYWLWSRSDLTVPHALGRVFQDARANYPYGDRVSFPFLDDSPNLAAVAFVVLAAAAGAILLYSTTRRDRRIAITVFAFAAGATLVTGSRTGFVALIAAAVPILFALPRQRRRGHAVIALAMAATIASLGYQSFPTTRALSAHDDTFVARRAIWSQAWSVVREHPLIGNGYHYSANDPFVEPASAYGSAVSRPASVHNEYLGVLVDGGLVGAFAFSAVLFALARATRALRRVGDASLAMSATSTLVAFAVSMLAGATLASAVLAMLFWLFLGIQSAHLESR
jgi:hypothetical protein